MDDMPFQNIAPTASSLTRDITPEEAMPLLPSRSMMLSKRDWEDLKSTIRELYLDRGQTLKQLAKYLEEHHRFKPT
jgi:Clr5 domain